MARIEVNAVLTKDYTYTAKSYGYGYENRQIYTFSGEDGKTYVWKTTSVLAHEKEVDGEIETTPINKGDQIRIKATVKCESEYNGQPQTIINRVKVLEIIKKAKTKKQLEAEKQEKQLASLKGEDILYHMPYRQYKAHYADCETLAGSYHEDDYHPATITVIVREGRLKNSGTRGMHYSGYRMRNENGEQIVYRAVSEENAYKRALKEYPGHDWKCIKVYEYQSAYC